VPHVELAPEEVKLATTLVEASMAKRFDFTRYTDEYTSKVAKLLEDKAAGKKIGPAREREEPVVINLMDALRKSLEGTKHAGSTGNGQRGRKSKTKRRASESKTRREVSRRKTG
jgi:DNA end-binding protein Ku